MMTIDYKDKRILEFYKEAEQYRKSIYELKKEIKVLKRENSIINKAFNATLNNFINEMCIDCIEACFCGGKSVNESEVAEEVNPDE